MAQTQQALYAFGPQGPMLPHTAQSDIAAGDILFFGAGFQRLVAVANAAIANGESGALETNGVYKVKKKAGETFSVGDVVGWDTNPAGAVADDSGDCERYLGTCWGAAAETDDYVLTRINFFADSATSA